MYQYFFPLLVQLIFCWMGLPHFVYPLTSWWTFKLFLLFGYYEKCCCENSCISFCVDICFHFSWVYTQVHMVTLYLTFWEIARLFSQWLQHYTLPCALYVSSNFSIFSPTLFIIFLIVAILVGVKFNFFKLVFAGFPGGAVVENLPANAGDTGSSPGLGRSHMPRSN